MNFAASLCKRLTVSNLVTKIPVYSSARGELFTVMYLRRASLMLHKSRRSFSSSHDIASTIDELNKNGKMSLKNSMFLCIKRPHKKILYQEMEFVFGEAPPTSLTGSSESQPISQDSEFTPVEKINMEMENESKLSHISVKGEAQMVDVSHKDISKRVAIASCKVILGKKVYDLVSANQVAKGDVLSVAKIAGITGAKQTSNLIPLCHNINLTHVGVDLRLNPCDYCVEIRGEAASTGKTGVEMEALTAVTLAGLTVYDMCKAASKHIQITDVRLEHKTGGKSGDWSREKKQ
ncbi:unnamed protein product [Lactuca saligna]|uniref:cyclic pyranopterin monophosphate synthase n=1 Tax=Lactuca saligna TaxID=75948 RepID=A0AA35XZ46_LACSI|nr:unnamed protein product [Lactuca saligna]